MLSFIIECTSFKGLLAPNLEVVFSLVDHEFHGSKTLKRQLYYICWKHLFCNEISTQISHIPNWDFTIHAHPNNCILFHVKNQSSKVQKILTYDWALPCCIFPYPNTTFNIRSCTYGNICVNAKWTSQMKWHIYAWVLLLLSILECALYSPILSPWSEKHCS